MGYLRRLKPGRTLLWSVLVFVICVAARPKVGRADVSVSVGVFIVDGFRYKVIGDAYNACVAASYTRCEIWDYNLIAANSGNGEVMDVLPWSPSGSGTPFDLHLGPGTLKICDACSGGLTFVIPKLSRVTGAGRTSDTTPGGTVIQAGAAFLTTGTNTLVRIGDTPADNSFGVLLSSVTVDCNYRAGCTGIENSSAQEQSGLEHVNVVNYSNIGVWIHGSNAQNSHYTDVEVNGCLSQSNCLNGTTPVIGATTVPLEIDNVPALRPIEGITVNPVHTVSSTITTISVPGGGAASTVTVTSSGFVSELALHPNTYVLISGAPSSGGVGTNLNGTYKVLNPTGTTFQVSIPNATTGCSAGCTGATATLVPTADVLVCSGTSSSCADSSNGNPTTVTFVGAHFENAGMGADAKGPQTTLNLVGGSCPITSGAGTGNFSNVAYCGFFEAGIEGGHIQNLYAGPASVFSLEDDNFSPIYQTNDSFIQLYDFGVANTVTTNRTRHCSEVDCPDQISSLTVNGGSGGGAATILAPTSGTANLTLPTSSGTLAQNFVGDGTVLSSTPANADATGKLAPPLANAGAGTLLGNPTGAAATPVYTNSPVLGLAGMTSGQLKISSSGSATNGLQLTDATISTLGTNEPLLLVPPGTGYVQINNAGAQANPSLVFTDTTTGFYKSGMNTWGWSANGVGEFIFAGQGIRLSNSTVYQLSPSYNTAADTGMSRCTTTTGSASAGTVCIGSGSAQSATGILHSGMTSALTTATTITSTSFVTTNIVLPSLPVSMVQGFECDIIFKQAATLTSDQFAIGASSTPTAIWVMAQPFNSTYAGPKYTTITSSTTTSIITLTPGGTAGTDFGLHISGALSTTSSNPVQLTFYAEIGSGGGNLTIEAGSQYHYTP